MVKRSTSLRMTCLLGIQKGTHTYFYGVLRVVRVAVVAGEPCGAALHLFPPSFEHVLQLRLLLSCDYFPDTAVEMRGYCRTTAWQRNVV